MGIDVGSDPEAENANLALGVSDFLPERVEDDVLLDCPDGGLAVGHEYDLGGTALGCLGGNDRGRLAKGFLDGGTADGAYGIDELGGLLAVFGSSGHHLAEHGLGLGGKPNDLEAILDVQAIHAKLHGLLGLLDLLASHRTRGIKHEHDVLWNGRFLLFPSSRAYQKHEVPAVIGVLGIMGEHAQVDVTAIFSLERIVKQEVGVGRHVLLLQAHHHSLLAVALDLGLVGR